MGIVLIVFLSVLLLAGMVLMWEARTGRYTPRTPWGATLRATLFFAAVVVGSALLMRTVGASVILAATLVPVTALSLLRLSMLVRPIVGASARGLATSAVLGMILLFGLGASLSLLPHALDQRVIVEQIFYGENPGSQRSIDPAARRVSRV